MSMRAKFKNQPFENLRVDPERRRTGQKSKIKIEDGFTLVEITIAITLFALIALILYGAFYLGRRAVEKADARSEASQKLRTVEEFLGGYIRSAYPYRLSLREPAIFFSGEDNQLEFVSSLSSGLGGRGLCKVRIFLDGAGGGAGRLTVEEEMPVRVGDRTGEAGYKNSVVLSEGARDLRIEYLDSQTKQDPGSQIREDVWVDRWAGKERNVLPRAVRLSQRGEGGEEVRWVFPVMMSVLTP